MKKLTRSQITESISTTWAKLEQAVQQELDRVPAGESELTASTTTAVVEFIEASKDISRDYISENEAWVAQINKITGGNPEAFTLPTFNDEGEQTNFITSTNAKSKTKRKK